MTDVTAIIDVQVHAYERNHPARPWKGFLQGPSEVTGDEMVTAMDAVGVDGALLVSPFSMYGFDASYALEVHAKHPGRFGLIKPFDPQSKSIDDEISRWAETPGVVGARLMFTADSHAEDPGINRILSAGAEYGLPVNILGWGRLPLLNQLAKKHPKTQIVVDHLGLIQPFDPPAPARPFSDLEKVVALADYDNVAIKISGVCTLSHQPFPFDDIWQPLIKVFNAFGLERCMWGTDWTRAVNLLTYEQGVEAFRGTDQLSTSERAMLMGGSLKDIYRWSPNT
ncbi:MAG: amidohydrolase family protein [bacterium]|nr:amidohydrolase [Gammaproteobacteria bacterium]